MKALLHVHSSYSYDGVPSLEDLSEWGASRGLDLLFLTEHTNDFDAGKMDRLVQHCDALSERRCRLVPGLEFAVRGGFHLLGYNVRRFEPIVDPVAASAFIRDQGGVAVLAHPSRYGGAWPERSAIEALDGIEVWNVRYDGRFLPPGRLVSRVAHERLARRPLLLFGGQDLHETTSRRLVTTTSEAGGGVGGFVDALRSGDVRFGAAPFRLDARNGAPSRRLRMLGAAHAIYRAARRVRHRPGARGKAASAEDPS